jgi:NitT/TauT family transport system substrate-binding protein
MQSRRRFLAAALTGAAGVVARPGRLAAEPPPETTRLRLMRSGTLCWAPQYVADALMRAEGFTDVSHVEFPVGAPISQWLSGGHADLSMNFVGPNIVQIDQGDPGVFLGGVHVGCFEVFGGPGVHKITDLKGKTVPVTQIGGTEYIFFATIAAYVGLDPRKDINWLVVPVDEGARLFAEGKVDAYIGFPPRPQELRARGLGHVIVDSAADRPWSHYFCCLLTGSRAFVNKHPVATKRAMRAILKTADLCAAEPERVARALVDGRFAAQYEPVLQMLKELPYDKWREYDPEDTLRFYALRLHEAGLIKATPQKLIAESADWRFLNEIKRELKI